MTNVLQDIRYGLRQLAKNPGFATVAVMTLALGIAANTVIFTILNATILKPLPFPDPSRLVFVWETFSRNNGDVNIISAPNYKDFALQNHVFENIAILDSAGRGYNLAPSGDSREPEQVSGLRVSSTFFPVLGVHPFLGRNFLPEEEELGKAHVVILSYGLWKRRYGADRTLVGKTIRIDSEDFTVVGVMPPDFQWQFWSGPRQLWVPVGYTETDKGRSDNSFLCIARLKAGVTLAQARAEMASIGTALSRQYPKELVNMSATVEPMADAEMSGVRTTMITLFAAVGFVLLIACVNVANLLLARGAVRQREFGLRRALGASGIRIASQLLTESVLLALLGGTLGVILAAWSVTALPSMLPGNLPLRDISRLHVDARIFAFAFVVSCLTGILFGIIPAISTIRGDFTKPLKEGSRGASTGRSRLRHALVASEVALALVVLCGAGLMMASLSRLLGVNPGFDARNVLTMEMSLPQDIIYVGPPNHPLFCRDIDEHLGAIPGVLAVGAVAHLPLEGNAGRGFVIEGRPDPGPGNRPGANYTVACPNYFRALGVPVLKGREFTHQDSLGAPAVIVINDAMAHKFWPDEDAVGRAIRLGGMDGPRLTIVGVVGDVHHTGLDEPARPQFFRPYPQAGWPVMSVVVKTAGAPATYTPAIKKALAEVEPTRPVSDVMPMQDIVQDSVGSRRFPAFVLSGFAGLALVLAAVGIVGVVSYSVAQRTQEIGIRMALGACKSDVLKLILSGSMAWVFIGIALGIIASLGLTRLLGTLLYGVKPGNPLVLGTVVLILAAVALLASYIPARRAAKVDPMVALRYE